MYLLDTSVCIAVMRGREPAVARLAGLHRGDCAVSVITEVELRVGAALSRFPEAAARQVSELLGVLEVVPWTAAVVPAAVSTALQQRRLGASLGAFDLLIAAAAQATGRLLVTLDRGFLRVPGLRVEVWST